MNKDSLILVVVNPLLPVWWSLVAFNALYSRGLAHFVFSFSIKRHDICNAYHISDDYLAREGRCSTRHVKTGLCSRHLLRLENPCCNACFTILFLSIFIHMPSAQNRSSVASRRGFLCLAAAPTAQSGLKDVEAVYKPGPLIMMISVHDNFHIFNNKLYLALTLLPFHREEGLGVVLPFFKSRLIKEDL